MTDKSKELLYSDLSERYQLLYEKSKMGCKFKHLIDRIVNADNIVMAYRSIKNNSGSRTAGLDGFTINDLKIMSSRQIIDEVRQRLANYSPADVRRVYIPKTGSDELRPLGIPSIWDRLMQQCILQVLEPIFEAKFHQRSYGFRSKRNAENAIADVVYKINQQHLFYFVNVDIHHFFDEIDHNTLLKLLWNNGIQDKKLLAIIKAMLQCYVVDVDGSRIRCIKGSPQGGILSPLLANVYLNELDWWISNQWETFQTEKDYLRYRSGGKVIDRSHQYRAMRNTALKEMYIIRYADDFKIVTDTQEHAEKIQYAVIDWLQKRLHLQVSENKTGVCDVRHESVEFLGFEIKAAKKGRNKDKSQKYIAETHISQKSLCQIEQKLSNQINVIQHSGNSNKCMKALIRYNAMVIGIHNYYNIATCCNDDLGVLSGGIQKQLYNRLARNNDVKRGGKNNFQRTGVYQGNDSRYIPYMKSATVRYYRNYPILPIGYVQHRHPMMKSRDEFSGLIMGDELLQKEVAKLRKSVQYSDNHSIEYGSNKIVRYIAQKGKCAVTGKFILACEAHGHHVNPYANNHDDSYGNIVVVHEDVHKLIHAVNSDVIQNYLQRLDLSKAELRKLNDFRIKVGLNEI